MGGDAAVSWIIISGGQTGVDTGAIEGALHVGLVFGGFAPAGFTTERGTVPIAWRFNERPDTSGLVEDSSPRYESRTARNVGVADLLLLVVPNLLRPTDTPGTKMTVDMAYRRRKALPTMSTDGGNIEAVRSWLKCQGALIRGLDGGPDPQAGAPWGPGIRLMVAGPRESKWDTGANVAKAVVSTLFMRVGTKHRQRELPL
jgi:hypothetical protein